jgi:RsiW-degrading membrane proteinase PrsW (M82 family)
MYVSRGGIGTAITRAFTAIPLHSFCGMFMGMFYAYAKKASILGNSRLCFLSKLLALVVPMLIHGTYDTLCFLPQTPGVIVLFYILVVCLYIVSIKTINRMSAEDHLAGFYPEARTIEYDTRFTDSEQ